MSRHLQMISEIMTENPISVGPDASLLEAYGEMLENDIRRLPVTASDGALVGIVTMSDIQKALPLRRDDEDTETQLMLNTHKVSEVMTSDPVCVSSEETIQDVAEVMLENQISGIPIIQAGKLVGIVTESDIFALIVETWGDLVPQ